jgi:hypothetical protein
MRLLAGVYGGLARFWAQPIRADYVGRNVPTSRSETVDVMVQGHREEWKVMLNEFTPATGE